MSLYREARSRRRRLWLALGVAAMVVAAVLTATVLLRGGEPTEAERLASLQDDVAPALAALELVPIHYESANPTTHAAAADQLAVARRTVADNEQELRAVDPQLSDAVAGDLARLQALVPTTGRDAAVEQAAAAAAAHLRALVGLPAARS